jgi:hypothetical protein
MPVMPDLTNVPLMVVKAELGAEYVTIRIVAPFRATELPEAMVPVPAYRESVALPEAVPSGAMVRSRVPVAAPGFGVASENVPPYLPSKAGEPFEPPPQPRRRSASGREPMRRKDFIRFPRTRRKTAGFARLSLQTTKYYPHLYRVYRTL